MGRLAVVGGHTILDVALDDALGMAGRERRIPGPGGPVTLFDAGSVVFLQRHRQPDYVPAYRLDHHAHAGALVAAGCDRVLAVGSVGGLQPSFPVGTTLVPDDFIAFSAQPDSRYVDERALSVPGFARTGAPASSRRGRRTRPRPRSTAASTGRRADPGSRPPPRSG